MHKIQYGIMSSIQLQTIFSVNSRKKYVLEAQSVIHCHHEFSALSLGQVPLKI